MPGAAARRLGSAVAPALGLGAANATTGGDEPPRPPPREDRRAATIARATRGDDDGERRGRSHRRKRPRREIASWWMNGTPPSSSSPAAGGGGDRRGGEAGEGEGTPVDEKCNGKGALFPSSCPRVRDGGPVDDSTSLSEGENWVACSFVEEAAKTMNAHSGRPLPLGLSLIKRKSKGESSLAKKKGNVGNNQKFSGIIPVLCIDVDDEGDCVAVKDIRTGHADNDDHLDAERERAEGLEFFLARRRRDRRRSSDDIEISQDVMSGGKGEGAHSSNSDEDGTSGYGTDDEKDANDAIEEMNERSDVRFCNDLGISFSAKCDNGMRRRGGHPTPPRETDVDAKGNPWYLPSEPLPRRQMRVLREGDRILVRWWSPSHGKPPEREETPYVKLEYLLSLGPPQQQHSRQPGAMSIQLPDVDAEKGRGEIPAESHILSLKSADSKSCDKRGVTLNSTSAVKAPTDDDDDDVSVEEAAAADTNTDSRRYNAGEEWSGRQEEGEGRDNNAEEDGDLSSCLTDEVMVKEQDYVSAVTGDGATTPSATAPGVADDGGNERDTDGGGDAATTSAVVLGADASLSRTNGPTSRELEVDKNRNVHADEEDWPMPESQQKDASEGAESNQNDNIVEFVEEAGAKTDDSQEVFLAVLEQDVDNDEMEEEDDEEQENSEEELLSQPEENSPVKFEPVEEAKVAEEDDDGSNGSETTDVSKTQPFVIPKSAMDKKWMQSLSAAEEEEDDSTESPEDDDDQGIAAYEEPGAEEGVLDGEGVADDTMPKTNEKDGADGENAADDDPLSEPGAIIKTSEKEGAEGAEGDHDSDDHWDEQPTQPWDPANAGTNNNEGQNIIEPDKDGTAEASAALPATHGELPETAEKEEANKCDSDDTSDEERTQKFPCMKPLGVFCLNEEACSVSPSKLVALPKTAEKEVADRHNSNELSDEELTQKFPYIKPLVDVSGKKHCDKDDEAYQAETQNEDHTFPCDEEDDVYHEETQTLLPLSFNLARTLDHSEAVAVAANNAAEESQEKLPAKPESQINHINGNKNPAADTLQKEKPITDNKISSPQTGPLGNAKTSKTAIIEEENLLAKSVIPNTYIEQGRDLTIDNEAAAEPTAAKEGLSSDASENGALEKEAEQEPKQMEPPPATATEVSKRRAAIKDAQSPPEKSNGVQDNEGHGPDIELPEQTSERGASGKESPLCLGKSRVSRKNEGFEKGPRKGSKSMKPPPAKEPLDQAPERRSPGKELPFSHEETERGEVLERDRVLLRALAPIAQRDVQVRHEAVRGAVVAAQRVHQRAHAHQNIKRRLKLGVGQEPESTMMSTAKDPSEQFCETLSAGKESSLLEKTSAALPNRGPEKGPPGKEAPKKPFQCHSSRQDMGAKKGGEQELESMKPPPSKEPPRRVSQRRRAPTANYNDSAIQKQRLENSAVTKVPSGAIVTGPVGEAFALSSLSFPCSRLKKELPIKSPAGKRQTKTEMTREEPRQSSVSHPNPPDVAATVCHMDNTGLKKDDLVDTIKNEEVPSENICVESRGRDPNIPSTISCISTRVGRGRNSNQGLTTPHHRPKRKRGTLSSGRRRASSETVRIMFTGIAPTRRQKQMIDDIGAQLVDSIEDAFTATHVIASDGKTKLRRTPKLMICVCKTSNILSIEWLEQSAKEQRVLDTNNFLLLGDREAEKFYNFSMKETLENGRKAQFSGGVLGGWSVYICSGVAGNQAPSSKELHLVVEATGATLLGDLKKVADPLKTIVITSDPSTQSQLNECGVARVEGLGAKILPTSWLFDTIITQTFSTVSAEGPTRKSTQQQSKRKASKSSLGNGNRRKSSRKR